LPPLTILTRVSCFGWAFTGILLIEAVDQNQLVLFWAGYYLCFVFMKKLLASITSVFYFAFSCGVMINLHYCMDEVDSVQLYAASDDTCNRCGMTVKAGEGCCRDEVTIIKLVDDQQTTHQHFTIASPVVEKQDAGTFQLSAFEEPQAQKHFLNHSPPILKGQDTYLVHRVFRI
jgi:hypothetical protein